MTAPHTAVGIVVVVLLILAPRVEPVIALVDGSLYPGIAVGLGFEGTIKTIVDGFGDIMAEVGRLIGFGVLLGALRGGAAETGREAAALPPSTPLPGTAPAASSIRHRAATNRSEPRESIAAVRQDNLGETRQQTAAGR